MENFTPTVTKLINNRLGKAYPERVSAELVESTFKFKDMNQAELASLFANLANETKIFSTCQDEIECETVQDMVDVGLVSFEWRDHNQDFGHMSSFEKYAFPLLGVQDINNNNKYSDAFYKCFRAAANNSTSDLFVCFDINKMAQHLGLCELDIFPRVAKYLINGLGLDCILESLPVKPCRRKDYSEVWCQLVTIYENDKVETRHAMFIQNTPALGRSCSSPVPRKIRVYFAMDDSVDISNPWGSCPILHNGSNFRVPDYSRYFNEFTDAANDDDNVSNTCFIYSQKHPTLEIPSKLNIEAEVLMRGIIEKSDTLFVEGVKDETLAIALGMCHPKARVRHVALFFFSIHLPLASGLFPETKQCFLTSKIRVGSDALIVTPNKVMDEVSAAATKPANEENARGENLRVSTVADESEKREDDEATANTTAADPPPPSTSTPSPPSATSRSCFTKNSISRKMSIASYTCLACNDRCTENQRFCKPVHVMYKTNGLANIHLGSSSCYQDPLQQQNRQHLSHGRGYRLIDLLAQSDRNMVKQFANIIFPAAATSSNFNITNCERSAMCHNFFCEGIEPVKTDFSSDDITKNKLVLYGKVLDVISSYSSNSAPEINRRRVFYGQEEKKANEIPACSDDAKAAFKDILVHECNKDRVEGYLSNTKLGSDGHLHHRWWLKLPELTANFKKHVERFYIDYVNVPDAVSLKRVFLQFYGVCKRYRVAKAQLLCCREDGKRRPPAEGEQEEEELGEREEGDGEGFNDESTNERLLHEVVDALVEFHARDEAITSTMIHKSMLLGSRTVVSGARCVVSTSPKWKFEVRQYVISMGGSAVTKVSDDNLKNFTPVRGAVSVTTAPNDRLPFRAHQTWRDSPSPDSNSNDNNNGKGTGNFNNGNDAHNKERNVNEHNWRVFDNTTFFKSVWNCRQHQRRQRQRQRQRQQQQQQQQQRINQHKPTATVPATNLRTASKYSSNKYIPPHKRQQQQQQQQHKT